MFSITIELYFISLPNLIIIVSNERPQCVYTRNVAANGSEYA